MTVLHSGTTKKYSENWDTVFGGKSKPGKQVAAAKATKKIAKTAKKRPAGNKKRR